MLTEMPCSSSMAVRAQPKRAWPRPRGPCIEERHKKTCGKESPACASTGSQRSSSSKQDFQEQKDRAAAASQSETSAGTESKPIAQIFLTRSSMFLIREAVQWGCLSFCFQHC